MSEAGCTHQWQFLAVRRGEHLCIEECSHCKEIRRFKEWEPSDGEWFYAKLRDYFRRGKEELLGPYLSRGWRVDAPDHVVGYISPTEFGIKFDPMYYTFSLKEF